MNPCPEPATEENVQLEGLIGRVRSVIWNTAAQRTLSQIGLGTWQSAMLLAIGKSSGCTCAQLAKEHGLDAGGLKRLVDRLEASGVVVRRSSSMDRRALYLSVTAKGEQVAALVPPIFAETLERVLQSLASDEVDSLKEMLFRILANAKQDRL